ncbi:MAG: hypothetical protein RIS20_347 [Bacteroidota bacterium]|jgi:hypothetical protein
MTSIVINKLEEISFPLIQKKKTITYKIVIGICIVLGFIALIETIERNAFAPNLMVIAVLFFLASQIFLDIRSLKIKEYQVIGNISLNKNEFILHIGSDKFEEKYSAVKSIILEVNETSRDPIFKAGVVGAGLFNRKRDGVENTISIEREDASSCSYKFLVEDIKTIYSLDDFLKNASFNYKLLRNGKKINSIKEEHLKDYPLYSVDTSK